MDGRESCTGLACVVRSKGIPSRRQPTCFSSLNSVPMPPANEQSPLLGHSNGVNHAHSYTFIGKVKTFIKAEGQPGWLKSFRWFIFGSWINILLVFIPLSFISHFLNMDAALRFVFSFIAIVPLAKVRICKVEF